MRGSSYRDRDYDFGQEMLTLRKAIKLTQAGLARHLGVSRKAFIALAVEQRAYPHGHEAEEIRTFWHTAHQKVLLDEAWLAELLPQEKVSSIFQPVEKVIDSDHDLALKTDGPYVDRGDALTSPTFYGREWEQAVLTSWIVEERCRVVSVLGLGGIGKSVLATRVMHQVAEHFKVVIWRSLRDAPALEVLLDECLQVLRDRPVDIATHLGLLLEHMRRTRVLLVLDNLEALLEEGQGTGHMRPGYEDYSRLLRQVAETEHKSCLMLTSREKPMDLVPLEGNRVPVRALRLARLDTTACEQLLAEKEVMGSSDDKAALIEVYTGNPLALKIVAQTIVDLFDGKIAPFLEQGEVVFGGVRELLDEQYARLADLERTILCWLAILREPVSIEELLAVLVTPISRSQMLEAIEALHRRSLIERGQRPGSFTLQSVVLEYITARLIIEAASEIKRGQLARLIEHGLELAVVKEYIRQIQLRLLVSPLLAQIRTVSAGRSAIEELLLALLDELRTWPDDAQGYGPTNVLALLRQQRGHLGGLDMSHLAIRGAFLQGVEMQDTSLVEARLHETVLNEAFDVPWTVAISRDGQYWAVSSRRGEVRVWREEGKLLHLAWQAHTDTVRALAFSPDGRTLATGSWDGSLKLWDTGNGALRWTSWFTDNVECLAFAPDGGILASSGDDATVQLWDSRRGEHVQTLTGPIGPVFTLAWSPDGHLLAGGSFDTTIQLWEISQARSETPVWQLSGHTNFVLALAFAPDGTRLASGSWDGTVRLWDVESLSLRQTLSRHRDRVRAVDWSPDGRLLASCGFDQTIWLWDVERSSYRMGLHGHTAGVYDIAFTPDSRTLLSSSEDGTLRVWEVERGQCVRILQGYAVSLYDVAWSPDGTRLASAGSDTMVTIWNVEGQIPPMPLHGHRSLAHGVAWSPDGKWLASSGLDNTVRLWDATTAEVWQVLHNPDPVITVLYGLAWSPDGTQLVSCGDDGSVCLWDATDGRLQASLQGHQGTAMSVVWSPDGTQLASGGGGRGGGELFIWEARSGERLLSWNEPNAIVDALAWSPIEACLLSGDSDGNIRWWDTQSGACVRVHKGHQGAVQSLRVSPNGKILASCGDDNTIHLWDLKNGEHLRTLRRDRPYERLDITGIKGVTGAQKATLHALGAIEDTAVSSTRQAL